MPGEMEAAGAIAQGIGSLINLGVGASQRHKGKKLLSQLGQSPTQYIPDAISQNQKMAELGANTGLPSEQYNQAMKNLQRNQMIALRGGSDRGAALGLVGRGQQQMDDSTLKLDAANANARMQNQRTLYGINNQVGQWQNNVWQNNVNAPYMRKYQYANSLLGSGNQNLTTGLDQLGAAGVQYGMSGGFRNKPKGYTDFLHTDSSNYD
jgi:hypothetical protein